MTDDFSKYLGENIQKYRYENKLTQKQLAEKCGLSRSYIGDIERGLGKSIKVENILLICKALNVTIDDLVHDSLKKYSRQNTDSKIIHDINKEITTFTDKQLTIFSEIVDILINQK